jgi:hypothetical protein
MPDGRGENEGFYLLPECVGPAIPEPGVVPPNGAAGRGENEGMHVLDEVVVDLSAAPLQLVEPVLLGALTESQQTALRVLVESGSLTEIARALGLTTPQARDVLLATVDSLRARIAG